LEKTQEIDYRIAQKEMTEKVLIIKVMNPYLSLVVPQKKLTETKGANPRVEALRKRRSHRLLHFLYDVQQAGCLSA